MDIKKEKTGKSCSLFQLTIHKSKVLLSNNLNKTMYDKLFIFKTF